MKGREAWHAIVQGVSKSWIWLSNRTTTRRKLIQMIFVNLMTADRDPRASYSTLPNSHLPSPLVFERKQLTFPFHLNGDSVK